MSLLNMINNKSPSFHPCGTHHSIYDLSVETQSQVEIPVMRTDICLLIKYVHKISSKAFIKSQQTMSNGLFVVDLTLKCQRHLYGTIHSRMYNQVQFQLFIRKFVGNFSRKSVAGDLVILNPFVPKLFILLCFTVIRNGFL